MHKDAEGGEVWELGPDAPLGEDLDQAEPLMPALVGVGRTAKGQEVLVNLEAFGSIALVGPGGPALLRSWVTELGTKPAGVIRTLMFLRRRQQRRVPLDLRPPQPGPLLVPTEVALGRAADTKNLGRLEAALAALSIGLASRDGEVATVLGVVVETDGRVKVCLGAAQDNAPEPFTALEGWAGAHHHGGPRPSGQGERSKAHSPTALRR